MGRGSVIVFKTQFEIKKDDSLLACENVLLLLDSLSPAVFGKSWYDSFFQIQFDIKKIMNSEFPVCSIE